MSFARHNLDVNTEDAPEFPNVLPPGIHVVVPFPVNSHPTWTVHPFYGCYVPPTFNSLIELPDARLEPAYYAAAVDTIRMTNFHFSLEGPYNIKHFTAELVRIKEQEWRKGLVKKAKNKDRDDKTEARIKSEIQARFPRPPDLRTLYVKEDMGHPTDESLKPLWTRACRDISIMSDKNKERYLRYTRTELVEQAKFETDESKLILQIFKRYLVWRNHVMARPTDQQPTRAEMEAFFDRDDVKKNGATLAEICHAFPHARTSPMLVYRIERFATLETRPGVKTKAGANDPVESVYMRKPIPTEAEILRTIRECLAEEGNSISFPELLQLYWPETGNQQFIADVLVTIAQPDLTTGRFILQSHEGPDTAEIYSVMGNGLSGHTLDDLALHFPDRIWSLDQFLDNIVEVAYYDEEEGMWYPFFERGDGDHDPEFPVLNEEESMLHRNRFRILMTWDPATVNNEYKWDPTTEKYVKRYEGLQLSDIHEVETMPIEPPSPTEIATESSKSPSPKPKNKLRIGVIAAVETTPIEAPVAPVERADGPSSRPPKRVATETSEPLGRAKKPCNGKIRCSQNTKKETRCRKTKHRATGETEWNCGRHNRG